MNTAELVGHKRDWENLASTDPLWAILSDPNKKDRRWNVNEFMDTGVSEAALVVGTDIFPVNDYSEEEAKMKSYRSKRSSYDMVCGHDRG